MQLRALMASPGHPTSSTCRHVPQNHLHYAVTATTLSDLVGVTIIKCTEDAISRRDPWRQPLPLQLDAAPTDPSMSDNRTSSTLAHRGRPAATSPRRKRIT